MTNSKLFTLFSLYLTCILSVDSYRLGRVLESLKDNLQK